MQVSGDPQRHSMDADAAGESSTGRPEFQCPQPMDPASHDKQSMTADHLRSQDALSQRTELTAGARNESWPPEEALRRSQEFESSGPPPQQEISLRDLALGDSASQTEAGNVATSDQLSCASQQEQQQPSGHLRQQLSGNPFQAAAMVPASADAPAGDGTRPSVPTRIATAPSGMQASPDNPFASPATVDDARQLVGDRNNSRRDYGSGSLPGNQPGRAAGPHQQSGTTTSVPDQHHQEPGLQAEQAASEEATGLPGPSLPASPGNATPLPDSSMHTATSIAQLLADLPPAGTRLYAAAMQYL